MWIIGLTGAIGSGKSTVSNFLRDLGVPVHCADETIHGLLESDREIQEKIKTIWPSVFVNGKINRLLLGEQVMLECEKLRILEEILYPKFTQLQKNFLIEHQNLNTPLVVLDVPLLMEVGLQRYCHYVILVTAPPSLRKRRVLRRQGMTFEKFKNFESNQMNDSERRKKADFMIPTGRGKAISLQRIRGVVDQILGQRAPRWEGKWPDILKREFYGKGNCTRHGNNRV